MRIYLEITAPFGLEHEPKLGVSEQTDLSVDPNVTLVAMCRPDLYTIRAVVVVFVD